MDLIHRRLHFRSPPGYRYWRIRATDLSWTGNTQMSMFRISFFASSDCTGTDLCLGKTASADAWDFATPPSNANDNNASTLWYSGAVSYRWWAIDLGAGNTADINSVQFVAQVWTGHTRTAKSFVLEYSADNTNWVVQNTFNTSDTGSAQAFNSL